MPFAIRKPELIDDERFVHFYSECSDEPTYKVKWKALKEYLRREISLPDSKLAPAALECSPAPKLACKNEEYGKVQYERCESSGGGNPEVATNPPKKDVMQKSVLYKVEFDCFEEDNGICYKTHSCYAGSIEDAINESKEYCKEMGWYFDHVLGVWENGIWIGGFSADKKQERAPDFARTFLVKYQLKKDFSEEVQELEFIAVASSEIVAINQLLIYCESQARKFPRIISVRLYPAPTRNHN